MSVQLIICFPLKLAALGIQHLLADDDIFHFRALVSEREALHDLDCSKADVILCDRETFSWIAGSEPEKRILLIDKNSAVLTADGELAAMVDQGLAGILQPDADCQMLKRAIHAVACDELWLDHRSMKAFFCRFRPAEDDLQLTRKELEILELLCKGCSNQEIAQALFVSEQTIKKHFNNLFRKFSVNSRLKLMLSVSEVTPKYPLRKPASHPPTPL